MDRDKWRRKGETFAQQWDNIVKVASEYSSSKVARRSTRYQIWEVKGCKDGQKMFLKNLDLKGGKQDISLKLYPQVVALSSFSQRLYEPFLVEDLHRARRSISICKDKDNEMEIRVDGQRTMQLEKMLRERDIAFEKTLTENANSPQRRVKSPLLRMMSSFSSRTSMDWKDYYPLHIVYNFIDGLETRYPSTCTVLIIGKSVEGRDIKMLKVSNSVAGNTGVWLDGAIHAREWISVSVVTYIAEHIAKNFESMPENIKNKDWYFVPVLNPDGYHHSHTIDRMWRKNRARHGSTIAGVDLNRNYGHFWGKGTIDNSSADHQDPTHLNYGGPEPFSEPETTAMKDFILYSGTPFKIFLTFHAFSELIAFPWCYTADPCVDYVSLLEGGTAMAKAIYETSGRIYKVGNFKDLMYYASGTSIDWSYGTARIPFSYLFELRSKTDKFCTPKEQILTCCKEILSAVKALAGFVDDKKCLNCVLFDKKTRR